MSNTSQWSIIFQARCEYVVSMAVVGSLQLNDVFVFGFICLFLKQLDLSWIYQHSLTETVG